MSDVRKSISVSDYEGASFVPEGYVVGMKITSHLTGEDGYTRGIIGSVDVTLTYGEVLELIAELSAVVADKRWTS